MATQPTAVSLRDCKSFEYHVDLFYNVARLVKFLPFEIFLYTLGWENGLDLLEGLRTSRWQEDVFSP